MSRIVEDDTVYERCQVEQVALLVDAEAYYRAFVAAARKAKRSILLSGWQFDTRAVLVRSSAESPEVRFLAFLNELCEHKPLLEIHILAWDYSAVYAVEREWLQSFKMALGSHPRVHFSYWTHPNVGGAYHPKYAIIDDNLAFMGGLDICDSRLDDRRHLPDDPRRLDTSGAPYGPFHDLQLALTGPVVGHLRRIFFHFLEQAVGSGSGDCQDCDMQPHESTERYEDISNLAPDALALRTDQVALSRTVYDPETPTIEIETLLARAIDRAEQLIYIENQYFTSQAILSAFAKRLSDESRSRLTVVFVMPDGADSPKEDFVLGDRQRMVRYALLQLAERHGHTLRFLVSSDRRRPDHPVSTFVHAKLLIVDDTFMTVGSANLTNRSMRIDCELNVSVEGTGDLREDIRSIRASLLAEHAGASSSDAFLDPESLSAVIDGCAADPESKLQHMIIQPCDDDPLLIAIFDPSCDLTFDGLEQAIAEEAGWKHGLFKTVVRRAGQRLGVVDTE